MKNKEEFDKMQTTDENHVYCLGEETLSKNGFDVLCCVPLNCIFQCLKYGDHIAIIENDKLDYSKNYNGSATAVGSTIYMNRQFVKEILDPKKLEVIDYIFEEVGDVSKIQIGHASEEKLGKETYAYLIKRLKY